jgi:hypothetical protein
MNFLAELNRRRVIRMARLMLASCVMARAADIGRACCSSQALGTCAKKNSGYAPDYPRLSDVQLCNPKLCNPQLSILT